MGERNKCIQALVLMIKKVGENNYNVCVFSKENSIMWYTLFGGPKSKLKSVIQPFNSGKMWIYEDKSKKTSKITDFEVTNYRLELKKNLFKIWAANLACEIIIKSKAAGDNESSFVLLSAFLDGIDKSSEKESKLGTIRFLWRYIELMGVRPEIPEKCPICLNKMTNKSIFYTPMNHLFLCSDCKEHHSFELSDEAVLYLKAINTLSPKETREIIITSQSVYQLRDFLFYIIEESIGEKLNSLVNGICNF